MRTTTVATAFLLVAFGLPASAQSDFSSFVYPVEDADSETYHFMDTVMVEYVSNFATVSIWTFCKPGVGEFQFTQEAPGFNATVPVVLNLTSTTPCWFNLRNAENDKFGANSQTFNVIDEERKGGRRAFGLENPPSKQPSLSSSSPSPESTSTPKTTPVSTPTSTSISTLSTVTTESAGETPSSGLSAGASAGIAVGVTVVVLALGFAGFFWFWRRKRRADKMPEEGQQPPTGAYGHGDVYSKVEAPPNYASLGATAQHHSYGHQQYPQHQFGGELATVNTPMETGDGWPVNGYGRRTHEMAG